MTIQVLECGRMADNLVNDDGMKRFAEFYMYCKSID